MYLLDTQGALAYVVNWTNLPTQVYQPGDLPIVFDPGIGMKITGLYRPSTATFTLASGTNDRPVFPTTGVTFGLTGAQPVMGDWDGDGVDGLGSKWEGSVWLRNSLTAGNPDIAFGFGVAEHIPIVGDWDGEPTP